MGGRHIVARFLGLALLLAPPLARAQTWSIQAVDVGSARAGSTSLVLDVSG
jgi:hypothetical protein